ncbi:putative DNA recombination and repair protein Rad51 [Helianthus annuus]|nr:putative DNA recombination and repair protein Rad51 [Helianthus annuus]
MRSTRFFLILNILTGFDDLSLQFTLFTPFKILLQDFIIGQFWSIYIVCFLIGGIETGSITEIYDEFRSGKTQLCHTLCVTCQCVTCQLPLVQGGGEGKAAKTLTDSRQVVDIVVKISMFGLNGNDVLKNVAYARAYNTDHQSRLLLEVASMMVETRFSSLSLYVFLFDIIRAAVCIRAYRTEQILTRLIYFKSLNLFRVF